MTIQIIDDNSYLTTSQEAPVSGRSYVLIDSEEYTVSMRNLWEALVDEWHKTGKYSFVDSIDKWRFRDEVKVRYGEAFDRLKYSDDNHKLVEVKETSEIPEHILLDFHDGNRGRIQGVVKSTTRYTKKQFSKMIDNTLNAMIDAGVDTEKFQDIVKTISELK